MYFLLLIPGKFVTFVGAMLIGNPGVKTSFCGYSCDFIFRHFSIKKVLFSSDFSILSKELVIAEVESIVAGFFRQPGLGVVVENIK